MRQVPLYVRYWFTATISLSLFSVIARSTGRFRLAIALYDAGTTGAAGTAGTGVGWSFYHRQTQGKSRQNREKWTEFGFWPVWPEARTFLCPFMYSGGTKFGGPSGCSAGFWPVADLASG